MKLAKADNGGLTTPAGGVKGVSSMAVEKNEMAKALPGAVEVVFIEGNIKMVPTRVMSCPLTS